MRNGDVCIDQGTRIACLRVGKQIHKMSEKSHVSTLDRKGWINGEGGRACFTAVALVHATTHSVLPAACFATHRLGSLHRRVPCLVHCKFEI